MSDQAIGEAILELADAANCASGDFHCLHFNIRGMEFDTLHAKVLKKYYEEAAEDFDELCEKACMFDVSVLSPNEAANRIEYQSWSPKEDTDKAAVIERSNIVMDQLLSLYQQLYSVLNKQENCVKSIGIANFLQTRIEYWSKERYYFKRGTPGRKVRRGRRAIPGKLGRLARKGRRVRRATPERPGALSPKVPSEI